MKGRSMQRRRRKATHVLDEQTKRGREAKNAERRKCQTGGTEKRGIKGKEKL